MQLFAYQTTRGLPVSFSREKTERELEYPSGGSESVSQSLAPVRGSFWCRTTYVTNQAKGKKQQLNFKIQNVEIK
jgi:hypothetical protein